MKKYKSATAYTMFKLKEAELKCKALEKNVDGLNEVIDDKNIEIRRLSEMVMQMRNFMHDILEAEWCETASGERWINTAGAWRENTANFVALFGEPREEE